MVGSRGQNLWLVCLLSFLVPLVPQLNVTWGLLDGYQKTTRRFFGAKIFSFVPKPVQHRQIVSKASKPNVHTLQEGLIRYI